MVKEIFVLFSAISFVIYSLHSVFSRRMILEFSRWGIGNLRILVASFQMLGGIGLLLGMYNVWLLCLVSFLLMLMMITAIIIRIRVRDSFLLTVPALIYALLSFIIFYSSLIEINT
tara:strand:+ start:349 stop:696 length:348 start_codon:yes stop_codon:yes gene_type:complete